MHHPAHKNLNIITEWTDRLKEQMLLAQEALKGNAPNLQLHVDAAIRIQDAMRQSTLRLLDQIKQSPERPPAAPQAPEADPAILTSLAELHNRLDHTALRVEQNWKSNTEQLQSHARLIENLTVNLYKVEQDVQELKNRAL